MSDDVPFRILPRISDRNRHFWTGGAEGELRFLRCQDDGTYVHPPTSRCPKCQGKNLAVEAVSGRGAVHTFSINVQEWMPGPEPPYVVAIVDLPEQEGLRLTTNIVNCPPDDVRIGMPVQVVFERHDDGDESVYLPLFEPVDKVP